MALKDLVEKSSAVMEEQIEAIISGYIIFDECDRTAVLTKKGMDLKNRPRVLVYLTALHGWQFITNEAVAADAKPAEIESATGITGNSVRPILSTLLKERMLTVKNGRYSIRSTSLATIEKEIASNR